MENFDNLSDVVGNLMNKHNATCECFVGHFLNETGYKAKDVKMIVKYENLPEGSKVTYTMAHKNTANKHLKS